MIIATKIRIPRTQGKLITRSSLVGRLNEGLQSVVTLVHAPPGYGKSTLLSEWAASASVRVAWVSLDTSDNDAMRFWTHVVAALKQANPEFEDQAVLSYAGEDHSGDTLIAALINGLNRLAETVALVWDDFHTIADPAVLQGAAYLLERLPAHVHIYIASRVRPSLPLSRMRAKGALIELDANDLRFAEKESKDFFENCTDLSLSTEERTAIIERTEGWIAGMRLAALSLSKRILQRDRTAIIHEIGRRRDFTDYFFEEVLTGLPESLQQFLLKTSILERMNDELSEAVTGMADAALSLRQLEQANLFLVSLDEQWEWYRYHHLFQQYLHMQLKLHHPEQIKTLHIAAARWLEKHSFVQEALEHYLVGGNYEKAINLLEEKIIPVLSNHERTTLHKWLNLIPDHVLFEKPMLFLTNLASLFLSGHIEASTEKYWWAANELGKALTSLPQSEIDKFQAGLSFLVAFRSFLEQDFESAVEYSQAYLQKDPEGELFVGFGADRDGYHPVWDIHVSSSSLRTADKVLNALIPMWSRTKNDLFTAHLSIDYGKLLYEWNRLEEAEQHVRKALDTGRLRSNISLTVTASLLLSRIYAAAGRGELAYTLLQSLLEQVDEQCYPNLHLKIGWMQARLSWMNGNIESAVQWMQTSGLQSSDEIPRSMIEEYNLLACVLADQGHIEEALELTRRLLNIAVREERQGDVIRMLLHKSLILVRAGKMIRSLDVLEEVLSLAEPEQYMRTFVDGGEPTAQLLTQYLQTGKTSYRRGTRDVSIAYVKRLLQLMARENMGDIITMVAAASASKGNALTPQESIVLKLIHEGMSNKDIARELDVRLSTVKTHVHHIYRKLGVNNRVLAAQRAKQLDLL